MAGKAGVEGRYGHDFRVPREHGACQRRDARLGADAGAGCVDVALEPPGWVPRRARGAELVGELGVTRTATPT
jgi:hypothetical protein